VTTTKKATATTKKATTTTKKATTTTRNLFQDPYYAETYSLVSNGKTLGWNSGGPVAGGSGGPYKLYNIAASNFPSLTSATYYGTTTLYSEGSANSYGEAVAVVLGCQGSGVPKFATGFVTDSTIGSWTFLATTSNSNILIRCSTQTGVTNYCISIPNTGGNPVMKTCDKTDTTQIFKRVLAPGYGK
jgi:hypothetical protein